MTQQEVMFNFYTEKKLTYLKIKKSIKWKAKNFNIEICISEL